MIIHSPETTMPEPYKTYVMQRNAAIGSVLEPLVDRDIQLCPRAILPDEHYPGAVVYGAKVARPSDGLKGALYEHGIARYGVSTASYIMALRYFTEQIHQDNNVRLKDPRESDGCGQHVVTTEADLLLLFNEIVLQAESCVLMPNFDTIADRVSVGMIGMGSLGVFNYVGRENTTKVDGREAYGGTQLALFHADSTESEAFALKYLDVSPEQLQLGNYALHRYVKEIAQDAGRVSVDVISGTTASGTNLTDVVDVTPRVGGTTPAEVMAIEALGKNRLVIARSVLTYYPDRTSEIPGKIFLDTPGLIISANIAEVL